MRDLLTIVASVVIAAFAIAWLIHHRRHFTRPLDEPLQGEGPFWIWTCMICHDWRPADRISVRSHTIMVGPNQDLAMVENVRYCNDRPACFSGAQFITRTRP